MNVDKRKRILIACVLVRVWTVVGWLDSQNGRLLKMTGIYKQKNVI